MEDKEWVVFSIAFELAVNIRFPPHVSAALDLMHEEELRTKSSFEERVVVETHIALAHQKGLWNYPPEFPGHAHRNYSLLLRYGLLRDSLWGRRQRYMMLTEELQRRGGVWPEGPEELRDLLGSTLTQLRETPTPLDPAPMMARRVRFAGDSDSCSAGEISQREMANLALSRSSSTGSRVNPWLEEILEPEVLHLGPPSHGILDTAHLFRLAAAAGLRPGEEDPPPPTSSIPMGTRFQRTILKVLPELFWADAALSEDPWWAIQRSTLQHSVERALGRLPPRAPPVGFWLCQNGVWCFRSEIEGSLPSVRRRSERPLSLEEIIDFEALQRFIPQALQQQEAELEAFREAWLRELDLEQAPQEAASSSSSRRAVDDLAASGANSRPKAKGSASASRRKAKAKAKAAAPAVPAFYPKAPPPTLPPSGSI